MNGEFSSLRMCSSEKNRLDLDVSKQYTLFVIWRDCWILTGSGAYIYSVEWDPGVEISSVKCESELISTPAFINI